MVVAEVPLTAGCHEEDKSRAHQGTNRCVVQLDWLLSANTPPVQHASTHTYAHAELLEKERVIFYPEQLDDQHTQVGAHSCRAAPATGTKVLMVAAMLSVSSMTDIC